MKTGMQSAELVQHSGNPAVHHKGSFWWCLFPRGVSWISAAEAHMGVSTAATCGHFLHQPAVGKKKDFVFLTQRILGEAYGPPGLAALGWLPFSLGTQGSVRPSLQWNQGQTHPAASVLVLRPGAAVLAIFPLSSPRGGEESGSRDMRRLWIRVCIRYLSPRSSKAFSCILFTSSPCQISLDENRAWQEGRKKEIT